MELWFGVGGMGLSALREGQIAGCFEGRYEPFWFHRILEMC